MAAEGGAALQGSGGATPAKEPPVGGGPVGQGQKREARHCTFTTPSGGSSSYSTALDLATPTAGAHSFSQRNY